MRRAGLLWGLLAAWIAGCATTDPVQPAHWFACLRSAGAPDGPDVIQMEMALIQTSVGDRTLNGNLWTDVDEQVLASDQKAALDDNGLRVGQFGGIPPVAFQSLLTSERSCIDPHRLRLYPGTPTEIVIGPAREDCRFSLRQDGRTTAVDLQHAEWTFMVVASLTDNGRTRLHFTPQVQHGQRAFLPGPTKDRSTWVLQDQRPTEKYQGLAWDVVLVPNEYVLVGGRFDRPDTLGRTCFIREDEPQPVQRLLVIRTNRPASRLPCEVTPDNEGETAPVQCPPLAVQAAQTTTHGSAP
jgi:hypothetical protein